MAYKNVNSSKKVNRSVYMEAEDLASIGCSMEVIATLLDIDSETLIKCYNGSIEVWAIKEGGGKWQRTD